MTNIIHPVLRDAYDADWYYPGTLPDEILNSREYATAYEQGWHEWIETPLDYVAMKHGYIYDLSRDFEDNIAYWHDGQWLLSSGDMVPMDEEHNVIKYVGKADQFMRFAEGFLRHTKGEIAGRPYRFLPWMRKACSTLFGWVQGPGPNGFSRYRRYQHAYIAISKKNGKSDLLSVIATYCLCGEGIPKAYVYGCATDRPQARIIYDEAASYVKNSPELSDIITVVDSQARLVHMSSGSFYRVLSADAHRNDGIDAYCTLVDEIHRHPNRKLYSVMKRAGRARPQKLLAVITTYGPSVSDGSIWAEVHTESKAQLEGRRPNAFRNFVFIASAEPIPVVVTRSASAGDTILHVDRLQQPVDRGKLIFDLSEIIEGGDKVEVTIAEPAKRFQDHFVVDPLPVDVPAFSESIANADDWKSDHAIRRANPSVGVIFPIDEIRKDIEESRTPETEAETRQLSLNIVSGSGRKWISNAAWTACKYQVQPKKLFGQHCWGGLDISFTSDLTAFALAFPNWEPWVNFNDVTDPRIDLLVWAWVQDWDIENREEKEAMPYRYISQQPYVFDNKGCVRICQGAAINYNTVCEDIMEICNQFKVQGIGYDPNYAQFTVPTLEEQGITCISHRQGAVSMSPPCKRFSDLVHKGQLAHGNNPILDRAIEGAQLHPPDKAGNTYLAKGKSHTRIDPLVASVMAVGFACHPPSTDSGAWSSEGSGSW